MSDIDLDAVDVREHERVITTLAFRYGLAALVVVTAAFSWSCSDPGGWRSRALACERYVQ